MVLEESVLRVGGAGQIRLSGSDSGGGTADRSAVRACLWPGAAGPRRESVRVALPPLAGGDEPQVPELAVDMWGVDGCLVQRHEGGVQVGLAAQRYPVGVGAGGPGADRPIEGDGLGPLVGVVVPELSPALVAGVRARYCEYAVTTAVGGTHGSVRHSYRVVRDDGGVSDVEGNSEGRPFVGAVVVPGPEPDWESAFQYQGGKRNPVQQYSMWDQAARHYREFAFLRLELGQIAHRLRLHVEAGVEDQLGDVEAAFFALDRVDFVVHRYVGKHGVFVGLHREASVDPLAALDRFLRVLGVDHAAVESVANPDGTWHPVEG